MCGVRLRWSRNASSHQTSADVITLNAEWYEASLLAAASLSSSLNAAAETSAGAFPVSARLSAVCTSCSIDMSWHALSATLNSFSGSMILVCILAALLSSSAHSLEASPAAAL